MVERIAVVEDYIPEAEEWVEAALDRLLESGPTTWSEWFEMSHRIVEAELSIDGDWVVGSDDLTTEAMEEVSTRREDDEELKMTRKNGNAVDGSPEYLITKPVLTTDRVLDACRDSRVEGEIADNAPPHAAFSSIMEVMERLGCDPFSELGKQLFLEAAAEIQADIDILEHNPRIACFHCRVEFLPAVDSDFHLDIYACHTESIDLCKFYRCPACGGTLNASKTYSDGERDLPWFHYEHGDDFDVADVDKPRQ